MIRTQLYLPETMHNRLKADAAAKGIKLSEIVRRIIDEKHGESQPASKRAR